MQPQLREEPSLFSSSPAPQLCCWACRNPFIPPRGWQAAILHGWKPAKDPKHNLQVCYIHARAPPQALAATSAVVRSVPPSLLTPGWSSQHQLWTFWICRQLSNSCHVLKRTRPKTLCCSYFFLLIFKFFFPSPSKCGISPHSHKNSTEVCAQMGNIHPDLIQGLAGCFTNHLSLKPSWTFGIFSVGCRMAGKPQKQGHVLKLCLQLLLPSRPLQSCIPDSKSVWDLWEKEYMCIYVCIYGCVNLPVHKHIHHYFKNVYNPSSLCVDFIKNL